MGTPTAPSPRGVASAGSLTRPNAALPFYFRERTCLLLCPLGSCTRPHKLELFRLFCWICTRCRLLFVRDFHQHRPLYLDEDRRYEPETADAVYTTDSQMRPGAISSAACDCFADGGAKSDQGPEKFGSVDARKVLLRQGSSCVTIVVRLPVCPSSAVAAYRDSFDAFSLSFILLAAWSVGVLRSNRCFYPQSAFQPEQFAV